MNIDKLNTTTSGLLKIAEDLKEKLIENPDRCTIPSIQKIAGEVLALALERQYANIPNNGGSKRQALRLPQSTDENRELQRTQEICQELLSIPLPDKTPLELLPSEIQQRIAMFLNSERDFGALASTSRTLKENLAPIKLQHTNFISRPLRLFKVLNANFLSKFRTQLCKINEDETVTFIHHWRGGFYCRQNGDCIGFAKSDVHYKKKELKDALCLPVAIHLQQDGYKMKFLSPEKKIALIEEMYEGQRMLEDAKREDYRDIQKACYHQAINDS